jgi:pilus assembly protein Flp/PilA
VNNFLAMLNDDEGATLVEYGLVVSLIAVAAIAAIGALGGQITTTFTNIQTHLANGK